jgi:hypothetical protein
MSSGQVKISSPHHANGVEVTHHEFRRVAANFSTPPPRPSARQYSSTGNIINRSRNTSPSTSSRSIAVSTTDGGRGPKTMAKRLGHILSPRRGNNHRSNSMPSSDSSAMDDSGASMSVMSDSDNATAQSIEGQQSVALTVDSHDTIKMSNKQHKKQSKTTHSASTSDLPPPSPSPSSSPTYPTHVKRPRGWQKLKRFVGGGGRPPTAPGGTATSSPSKGAGDGGGFARPHSKSYDEGPMTSPPDRTSNRSRFESADLAGDRKASSTRTLSAWDRSHLDLAIRGRLDGVDVLFLGPARRSPFPMPASSTIALSSSGTPEKSPLHSMLESWSWSSPPSSEVPQDTVVEEAEIKPQIYIDPLKLSFTGIPTTYTAADLVSDMVLTSAGRDKPELIFEGYIPGGGDRWCVKLEETAATTAKAMEPKKSSINMEAVVSATTITTVTTEESHDDDEGEQSWKGPLREGSGPAMPPLQATFDDESTSHTVGTAEMTDDGSTNLPTQKLWDNMWGNEKTPPIPSHMQIGYGSFDAGDGDDSKDEILQLASACSVPIDLDEDSFMIDGPDHLRSVHELVMIPIQVSLLLYDFIVPMFCFGRFLCGCVGWNHEPRCEDELPHTRALSFSCFSYPFLETEIRRRAEHFQQAATRSATARQQQV